MSSLRYEPTFDFKSQGIQDASTQSFEENVDSLSKMLARHFNEQDAINELCQGGILPLDPKYNVHTWSYPTDEKPVIVHYAGYEEAIWSRFELPQKYASIEVTK